MGIGTATPATTLEVNGAIASAATKTYQVTRGASAQAISLLSSNHTQHYSSGRFFTVKGSLARPGNSGAGGVTEFTLRAFSGDGLGGAGNYNFQILASSTSTTGSSQTNIPVLSWSGSGGTRTLVLTAQTWSGSSGVVEYGGYEAIGFVTWL